MLLDQEWAVLHRKVRGTGQRPDETKLQNLRRLEKVGRVRRTTANVPGS